MSNDPPPAVLSTGASAWLLARLRWVLLRNRVRQLVNQSPLRLLTVLIFVAVVWGLLFGLFDYVFRFMRRFEQSVIAIPYVFHIFFVAMTLLLALSSGIIVYNALFIRAEQTFLMAGPHRPKAIVLIMFLEALFFASWSLVLLGLPLMLAVGQDPTLTWRFHVLFLASFLAFVPIPGAVGLITAWLVAMYLPRSAKRALFWFCGAALAGTVIWWGRLWTVSRTDAADWVRGFLNEFQYFKAVVLPSTWISHAIRHALEDRTMDALFYLGVTAATALFLSWTAVNLVGGRLLTAFGRAYATPTRSKSYSSWATEFVTRVLFFYLDPPVRQILLKDLRTFLRDPMQWSQLAVLFGLLSLYLFYLPKTRPDGFNDEWKAFICFLNYGAVSLILSTFTSRFVFPMVSLEGRQMWMLSLLPVPRRAVVWAKFNFALTLTASTALTVTWLSIRALQLPMVLALAQAAGTLSICVGLCGLAIGLGARLPNYRESSVGRISAGIGGTANLIVSIILVTASVLLMGVFCWGLVQTGHFDRIGSTTLLVVLTGQLAVGFLAGLVAMRVGVRAFERASF